jgi:hypothetical protein
MVATICRAALAASGPDSDLAQNPPFHQIHFQASHFGYPQTSLFARTFLFASQNNLLDDATIAAAY